MTPDDLFDPDGRAAPEHAERLLSGVGACVEAPVWTRQTVMLRLQEAAETIERCVRAPGPSQDVTFWPESSLFADATDADRNTIYQGEKDGTRAPAADANDSGGGAREISRAEQAVFWPMLYLSSPKHEPARMALSVWGECMARRRSFSDAVERRLGCSRRTAYNRIDAAIDAIMAGLIRDNIQP